MTVADKIEPALTPEDWVGGIAGLAWIRPPWLDVERGSYAGRELVALVALANAALSDSDPHKIKHADVDALREYSKRLGTMARANCLRIAAILESYLPPQT